MQPYDIQSVSSGCKGTDVENDGVIITAKLIMLEFIIPPK